LQGLWAGRCEEPAELASANPHERKGTAIIERIAILGLACWAHRWAWRCVGGFQGQNHRVEPRVEGAQKALAMGAVDGLASDALEAARASQVVLLAVPIYSTLDWMEQLSGVLGQSILSPMWEAPKRKSRRRRDGCSIRRRAQGFCRVIPWQGKNAAVQS